MNEINPLNNLVNKRATVIKRGHDGWEDYYSGTIVGFDYDYHLTGSKTPVKWGGHISGGQLLASGGDNECKVESILHFLIIPDLPNIQGICRVNYKEVKFQ